VARVSNFDIHYTYSITIPLEGQSLFVSKLPNANWTFTAGTDSWRIESITPGATKGERSIVLRDAICGVIKRDSETAETCELKGVRLKIKLLRTGVEVVHATGRLLSIGDVWKDSDSHLPTGSKIIQVREDLPPELLPALVGTAFASGEALGVIWPVPVER
jgi:hypothetical protein